MTIRELLVKLESIPAEEVMYAKGKYRLWRVAKCRVLRRELSLYSEQEKDETVFQTSFDGWESEWTADQIGTKEEWS